MEKLNPAQFQALQNVALGRVIEVNHRLELSDLGLIQQKLGGWVLTHEGRKLLAFGNR